MGFDGVDQVLVRLIVQDPGAEAAHLPARNAEHPEHDVHGRGKVLAEAFLGVEEEVVQLPHPRWCRRGLQGVGESIFLDEPRFDRLGLVIGGGGPRGANDRLGKLGDLPILSGARGHAAVVVEGFVRVEPGRVVGAGGLQVLEVHIGDRLRDRIGIGRLQPFRKLDLVDRVEAGDWEVVAGDVDEGGPLRVDRRADRSHDSPHLAGLIVDRDDLTPTEDGVRRLLGWNEHVEGGVENLEAQARR